MTYFSSLRIFRHVIIAIALVAIFIPVSSAYALDQIIRSIKVENNQRVEVTTILSYMTIHKGERYNEAKINQSLKRLYGTDLFSDISIKRLNNTLIVFVEENPIINKIAFEGNKRIDDDTLSSEIRLAPRSVYTRSKLQNDAKRVQSLYQKSGRFSVSVVPKVIQLDQNRINLIFEIEEADKATVQTIHFIGNKAYSADALQGIINTSESRWYNFMSSNDTYDPDRVSYDKELLRQFYLEHGYADFKVISSIAEISKDRKSFILTFSIEEGNRYRFGNSKISNKIKAIDTTLLQEKIETLPNEIFNAKLINSTIDSFTQHLNDDGYAFVDIEANYTRDIKDHIVNLTYSIQEGPKVYINRINVSGNVRTLDKVVRREFRLSEGDPFNASKLQRSRQRIQNLGFFEKVDIEKEPTRYRDKVDIDVNVEERSTGELNFGAGFSTTDGALGNISIRERNLLGRGQDLRAAFQRSSKGGQISLGFTEPYFLGRNLSAGFDIFTIARDLADESSFNSATTGGTLRLSYALTEHLKHTLRYSLQNIEVDDVQTDASLFIRQQEGNNSTSLVGHTLTYDLRDNRFDPKEGYFVQLLQDIAGLGGNSKYFKNELRAGYYTPVYSDDVIMALKFKGGNISGYGGKKIRINERFFVGGTVIRGFDNAGVGPRDISTSDALGGKSFYATTAEVMFPLGLPDELGFKGAIFTDAGSLFDTEDNSVNIKDEGSIRISSGIGISWKSPLGPIRLDFSRAFVKEDHDKTRNIQFNFGTRF